jgi:hypothetical protein
MELENNRSTVVGERAVNVGLLALPEDATEMRNPAALRERVQRKEVVALLRQAVAIVGFYLVTTKPVTHKSVQPVPAAAAKGGDRFNKFSPNKLVISMAHLDGGQNTPFLALDVPENGRVKGHETLRPLVVTVTDSG